MKFIQHSELLNLSFQMIDLQDEQTTFCVDNWLKSVTFPIYFQWTMTVMSNQNKTKQEIIQFSG